ncbi:MAG: metallophosphoesterase [Sandaracinaceae bacterium]
MPVGIIGDVHLAFDEIDVRLLDEQGYDLCLFVGDLAGYFHSGGVQVGELIARLRTPTFVIPGNHDTVHVGQLAAEVLQAETLIPLLGYGHQARADELRSALSPATQVGYSRHRLSADGVTFDLIAARPHSAGGEHLAYRPYLRARYGIDDLERSATCLCELVDGASAEALVFLAHNGPTGLGASREAIWGCDFRREEGDFGDPDLRVAVDHALARGKRVLAVVAGHMHHELRGGGTRRWIERQDGVLYINAARVPRIFADEAGEERRHHVRLRLSEETATAEEVLLSTPRA